MSWRKKIIIIGTALIVLIGGSVAVVLVVRKSPALQNTIYKVANVNAPAVNTNQAVTNVNAPVAADTNRSQINYVARNFAERFGSGSNQNQGSNYMAAQEFGTKAFNTYLTTLANQEKNKTTTGKYHGYISRVLTITITKLNTLTASAVLGMQRQETLDTTTKNYNQNLSIELQKVGSDWKIDAAAWQ